MTVLIRGNPETPGPEAPRRFLSILGGDAASPAGSGRLELARAIASPDNPLTARVMVNRVWQHHFGRGLVGTPSNFGKLGERPTHPELLDYLAAPLRRRAAGRSRPCTARSCSRPPTSRAAGSTSMPSRSIPRTRLLWRMNRRRLEVEAWRDAMLAVSGRLDPTVGGPSRSLDDPENRRRTFYAAVSRHDLDPLLRLFDFPDPNITSGERTRHDRAAAAALRPQQRVRDPERQGARRPPASRPPTRTTPRASGAPTGCSSAAPPGEPRGPARPGLPRGPGRRRREPGDLTRLGAVRPGPARQQRVRVRGLIDLPPPLGSTLESAMNRPIGAPMTRREVLRQDRRRLRGARAGRRLRRRRPAGLPRGAAEGAAPADPLAPKPPHFAAAGQAGHLPVHERRPVARRHLRPQAGARASTHGKEPPAGWSTPSGSARAA